MTPAEQAADDQRRAALRDDGFDAAMSELDRIASDLEAYIDKRWGRPSRRVWWKS